MADKNSELLTQRNPWSHNTNTIWLASNISLRRNVEKFRFPGKMNVERRKQMVSLISGELLSSSLLNKAVLLKGEETGPLEKEFMVEHMLSSESIQGAHLGEAFVIDSTGAFLCSINIKDHLHFQEIDIKEEIEAAWGRLVKIESRIGEIVAYAYSSQFGFLTADPTECGTGLHATLFLQPSALIHTDKLKATLEKLEDNQVLIQNFLGHTESCVGDILIATNNFTLGFNEETILACLRSWAAKMIQEEKKCREEIASQASADMKDKVARAWAVLIHSYQIETQEALNAIALVKLGCDLKWIGGIEIAALNELFFNCRSCISSAFSPIKSPPIKSPISGPNSSMKA